MRDLTRPNALKPAYVRLTDMGFDTFTPLVSKVVDIKGRRERKEIPFIHDLLFVRSDRMTLDPVVERTDTLQYRFVKGKPQGTVMTVPAVDMNRFMIAVSAVQTPVYLGPDEITPEMYGSRVRLLCEGPLNGFEGRLLRIKGSGKKRLIVELPGIIATTVEIAAPSTYVHLLPS